MKKLEIYLEELRRDCNQNLKSNGEEMDCEHYTAIEILKVVIKIKDILDEQK
jgi:predicted RNA-binding protein